MGGRAEATETAAAVGELVGGLGVLGLVDPCDLDVLGDPPAHRRLERQGDDEGDDTRDDEGGEGDEDLDDGLVDAVTVEQATARGEQAGADGAPEAGDEVDADDVERVVVAEACT